MPMRLKRFGGVDIPAEAFTVMLKRSYLYDSTLVIVVAIVE